MPQSLRCISFDSYIKPQLPISMVYPIRRCISFDSYIKPQHIEPPGSDDDVVYLLIPTSNHNELVGVLNTYGLYIF